MSIFKFLPVVLLPLFAACGSATSSTSGGPGGAGGSGETGGSGGAGAASPTGGGPECPSLDDPAVHYISEDPALCDQTDCGAAESDCVPCSPEQEYFSSECGCGCIDVPTCPDPNDPAVHYLETDPALCDLTDCGDPESDCIPCDPAQEYFSNECGCGCIDPGV
jgi:hypothetical protein